MYSIRERLTNQAHFVAILAPTEQRAILFMHVGQASRAVADVAMWVGGVAVDKRVGWDIARHHRASADERERANRYAADDYRACADRCAVFDQRGGDLPVVGAF